MKQSHLIHTVVLFVFLMLPLPAFADVTIAPNGLLSWGTTMTIHVSNVAPHRSINFEIFNDTNRNGKIDKKDKKNVHESVQDNSQKGMYKDSNKKKGSLSITYQIAQGTPPEVTLSECYQIKRVPRKVLFLKLQSAA